MLLLVCLLLFVGWDAIAFVFVLWVVVMVFGAVCFAWCLYCWLARLLVGFSCDWLLDIGYVGVVICGLFAVGLGFWVSFG